MEIKNTNKTAGIRKAFTLIEIMVGIIIVSMVFISGFKVLSATIIGKAKLIQRVDTQKDSFYFTEKLFEMIKTGGTLDYEEYFNRSVIGNTIYSSGHFDVPSGFGNFGSGGTVGTNTFGDYFYFCTSGIGVGNKMTNTGCVNNTFNTYGSIIKPKPQRYGQYSFQFLDYNSNFDNDGGDEDGDLFIKGDDDDEYIGDGPEVFLSGASLPELYLISGNKKERTYFRWNVVKDQYAPATSTCTLDASNAITGTGCIGTVEYIKLLGKDLGENHDMLGNTYLDGLIDTWVIDPEISGSNNVIAGTGNTNWVPLFSDKINVTQFSMSSFPNKDGNLAWKNNDNSVNISPFTILKLKLKPSWITKRKIGGDGEELDFSMTINLTDIYSQ